MDNHGQISAEFLMIMGFVVVVSCSVIISAAEDSELTHVMAAARSGASQGAVADSLGVYSDDAFSGYLNDKSRLISPSSVKIVKVEYINRGFNRTYNRTLIQLRIYATSSRISASDQYNLGERINYDARRSICKVFGTENMTNFYYDPAFSYKYVFKTLPVVWV